MRGEATRSATSVRARARRRTRAGALTGGAPGLLRGTTALLGAVALCGGLVLPAAAAAQTPPPTAGPSPAAAQAVVPAPPQTAPGAAGTPVPAQRPTAAAPGDGGAGSSAGGIGAGTVGTAPTAPAPDPAAVAAYEQAVAASAESTRQLAAVSARAGAALEARDAARGRHDAAVAEQEQQRQVAASAATLVARERSAVGRWASSSYRGTEDVGAMPVASALLGGATTDEVGSQLTLLEALGRHRVGAVRGALDAETLARQALARAEAAAAQAVAAQAEAEAEAAAAEDALVEQRDLAASVDAQLAAARERLGTAVDAARQAADLAAAAGAVGPVDLPAGAGGCASSDVSAYPNGEIPLEALCPLASAPGHRLRADAARAFDAMSRAYAQTFGQPLCVTDSYRSLPAQISVRARKPGLAAVPGTSRHGLGRAVDLCGGVEDFGTPQHEWTVQRAPLFGFFQPSWAAADGSRPEPWHFEFAEQADPGDGAGPTDGDGAADGVEPDEGAADARAAADAGTP